MTCMEKNISVIFIELWGRIMCIWLPDRKCTDLLHKTRTYLYSIRFFRTQYNFSLLGTLTLVIIGVHRFHYTISDHHYYINLSFLKPWGRQPSRRNTYLGEILVWLSCIINKCTFHVMHFQRTTNEITTTIELVGTW